MRKELNKGKLFKNFKVSNKRRLWDPLPLKVQGKMVSKKVECWIKEDPQRLYEALYNGKGLSLASDALKLLKDTLKQNHPEQALEIKTRRIARAQARKQGELYIRPEASHLTPEDNHRDCFHPQSDDTPQSGNHSSAHNPFASPYLLRLLTGSKAAVKD